MLSFHVGPVVWLKTVGAIATSRPYCDSWRTLAETMRSGFCAAMRSRLGAASVPTGCADPA